MAVRITMDGDLVGNLDATMRRTDGALTASAKVVFAHLALCSNDGIPWFSEEDTAATLGLSPKTIQTGMDRLATARAIHTEQTEKGFTSIHILSAGPQADDSTFGALMQRFYAVTHKIMERPVGITSAGPRADTGGGGQIGTGASSEWGERLRNSLVAHMQQMLVKWLSLACDAWELIDACGGIDGRMVMQITGVGINPHGPVVFKMWNETQDGPEATSDEVFQELLTLAIAQGGIRDA